MDRPNIVLIVADQFRGDCLGFAGHPDVKTPYLDTLAARGMSFPNMYSACPSCIPARAALLTGMSQARNGRVGYQDGIDWNYEHTLAGELADLGYATHCVGKMHVHPPRSRMGFHDVEIHDGYLHYYRREDVPAYQAQDRYDDFLRWLRDQNGMDCDMNAAGVECVSWIARPWPYEERLHPTNWATDRAIDFLRRRDHREPFFLMVSYVRPHPPFDAPACYFDMYRDMEITPPISGDWDDPELLKEFGRMFNGRSGPADPELIRQAQTGYYACITHLDHQLDRLLEALQYTGDTLVMFTADHGEMLCDHHRFGKTLPYRGSANVPLILSGFGKYADAFRGINPRLGELRDILPTLVAQAGGGECPFSDGGNLLDGNGGREYIHGEHAAGESSNHFIVTAHDKYIWFSQTGREQYFDLGADPRETHDAFADPQYAERIACLRALLVRELEGREEGYTADGRLIVGRTPQNVLRNPGK